MADLTSVLADLTAEGDALDALVAPLAAADWARDTPAEGWTIAHQIAHLAWTDDLAQLAATDASAFQAQLQIAMGGIDTYADQAAAERAGQAPDRLIEQWRAGRAALVTALVTVRDGTKLPWFGPPMNATSMATARLMETWAHGQDVADALGVSRAPTHRLKHVAHLGVRTRDFAYLLHDRKPPVEQFRVELTGPDGDVWAWGPADAEQRVTGPALDFCLLVTQRRDPADLALHVVGQDADAWLGVAQAFAGPPGRGRKGWQFA